MRKLKRGSKAAKKRTAERHRRDVKLQACKFDVAYGIAEGLKESGLRIGNNERMRIAGRICGKAVMHARISMAR